MSPAAKKKSSGRPKFKVDFSKVTPQQPRSIKNPDRFKFKGYELSPDSGHFQIGGQNIKAKIDDFTKIAKRGRGVHGCVWEVTLKIAPDADPMAMKEIELQEANETSFRQIVRELEVLKKGTKCPYIIGFHCAFYRQCTMFLVMEYMDIGSWDKVLQLPGVTRIPEAVAGQVALSTLRGLTFLKESLNVIHRDIKPSNILLNSKGEIKVCDFSVSGELDKSMAKTYTGTQYYMAPERIRPSASKQYDIRSDVWSLGLTLVELAMGEYPYPREENVFAMLTHIIKGPTPIERETFTSLSLSAPFVSFCDQCLRKEVAERSTAKALLEHEFMQMEVDNAAVVAWLRSCTHADEASGTPADGTQAAAAVPE